MTKRMLIDATHAEETRVVVLDGNRLEDFDVETSTKRQLKGNIYLAKVVRVEPSLQAAFVEYGGNRHGFLAFSEIHPDYYQIPVADRQRLIEMEAEEARREEEEADLELALDQAGADGQADGHDEAPVPADESHAESPADVSDTGAEAAAAQEPPRDEQSDTIAAAAEPEAGSRTAQPLVIEPETLSGKVEQADLSDTTVTDTPPAPEASPPATETDEPPQAAAETGDESGATEDMFAEAAAPSPDHHDPDHHDPDPHNADDNGPDQPAASESAEARADAEPADESDHAEIETIGAPHEAPPPETVGGEHDNGDDTRERRIPPRFLRNYKIQEVIRRRQILLVQVVKEERGTKGAALTTYLSLAGRFGVLMPNSPRGGGISRKITSATDRRRLKEVMTELDIPKGMGLIIRTAGATRPKPEIKRDCEYLLRLWDDIREHTMKSVAPALIYEEASLIKRAIRDVYSRDIDEILVDGEEGWRAAHEFMRMLMPTHAKKVQLWRDANAPGGGQPLFARHQVEAQLDAMLVPIVQLRSGGYLVINQAEALVAIDVNSGRSTRERNIEETALRTNLEAADEVARQLRLRDLAGLIVIDFIDMESKRHNAMVERRLKEALKNDRARIQVGHISHFGLLEMSRQRLHPSLAETSFIPCPHCGGTGHVRSTESAAIHVLRGIEEEGGKRRAAEIIVHVATPVALYLLNHKRERLREIELRYAMRVIIAADDSQIAPRFRLERVRAQIASEAPAAITPDVAPPAPPLPEPEAEEEEAPATAEEDADEDTETAERGEEARAEEGEESAEEAERRRRRRRRRRRGRREDEAGTEAEPTAEPVAADAEAGESAPPAIPAPVPEAQEPAQDQGDQASAPQDQEPLSEVHIEGVPEHAEPAAPVAATEATEPAASPESDEEARARRRSRRGGRRRRRDSDTEISPLGLPGAEQPDLLPAWSGPTPANPFGGQAFDIFDVMDQVEQNAARAAATPAPRSEADIVNATAPEPAIAETPALAEAESVTPGADASVAEAPPAPAPEAAEGGPAMPTPEEPPPEEPAIVNAAAPEPTPDMHAAAEPATPDDATAEAQPVTADAPPSEPAATPEPAAPDAPIVNAVAPEPAVAEPVLAEAPAPANDTAAEPAVKPILIGSGTEPPAEKKRGWWRR